MEVYTVAFIGHRYLDDIFRVEAKLEAHIKELLQSHEYVEFLVGRDGEFDQAVASTVRRMKRAVGDCNSSLVWVLPYPTAEYENNVIRFTTTTMRLSSVKKPAEHTSNLRYRSEIAA